MKLWLQLNWWIIYLFAFVAGTNEASVALAQIWPWWLHFGEFMPPAEAYLIDIIAGTLIAAYGLVTLIGSIRTGVHP